VVEAARGQLRDGQRDQRIVTTPETSINAHFPDWELVEPARGQLEPQK